MSGIKIYQPSQLPAKGVSDAQFGIWKEELEVYLETKSKFDKFLPGGRYKNWQPAETLEHRIEAVVSPDTNDDLIKTRKDLRQFITLVAKYVHIDYYNPIIRHSISLNWIYNKIREDYNIQQQGIHFLNILDQTWDPTGQTTPTGFYNSYRSLNPANLGKKGDSIEWKQQTLKEDERLTPSHEDLISLNVLHLIHPQLPHFVKQHYAHKMDKDKRLMCFKTEILTKAKVYLAEIEAESSASPQLAAIRMPYQRFQRPQNNFRFAANYRGNAFSRPKPPGFQSAVPSCQPQPRYQSQNLSNLPFCRLCHLAGHPRSIFTSHHIADTICPSLSQKDKAHLTTKEASLNIIQTEPEEDDFAAQYGYEDQLVEELECTKIQVTCRHKCRKFKK